MEREAVVQRKRGSENPREAGLILRAGILRFRASALPLPT